MWAPCPLFPTCTCPFFGRRDLTTCLAGDGAPSCSSSQREPCHIAQAPAPADRTAKAQLCIAILPGFYYFREGSPCLAAFWLRPPHCPMGVEISSHHLGFPFFQQLLRIFLLEPVHPCGNEVLHNRWAVGAACSGKDGPLMAWHAFSTVLKADLSCDVAVDHKFSAEKETQTQGLSARLGLF